MSTPHAPKPLLPKIKDFANGTLPAAPHDHVVTADVLDVMLNEGDSVTLSISGSNFFKVARATVYDVDWEVIDSSELPRGHHGPVREAVEDNPTDFPANAPVPVNRRQRLHVYVSADVPSHPIPPGAFSGSLVVKGQSFSRTLTLLGTFLDVALNTPIGQR